MEEIFDKQYGSGDDEITMEEAQPTQTLQTKIRNSITGEGEKMSSLTSARPCRLFSLAEIASATNNFDDDLVIGWLGFGKVYKGLITSDESGHVVAIKRLNSMPNQQGELEFWDEIDILCNFHHPHLVSLVGYCNDDQEKILVYEYMTNGSLYEQLQIVHTTLSWERRLRIAIGVARVLDYLHTGVHTRHGIIHRNVKSATILLDENWEAVISGLGFSITGPTNQSISYVEDVVVGTLGYVDPEYFMTGKLTYKADVYSFGVVLFELLSGRRATDTIYGKDETNLVKWARKCVKVKKLNQVVDPRIEGTISSESLRLFAQIADRCVHDVSKKRPNMSELVASLEAILDLQEKSDRTSATKPNSDASGTSLWRRMKSWLFR